MRSAFHRLKRAGRWLRNTLLALAAVIALLVIGLTQSGLPDGLTRRIVASLNSGDYAVELDRLRLDLPAGVRATAVRVYRKGVVAPPVFEAASVRLGADPFFWRWGKWTWFRDLDIRDGAVRRLAAVEDDSPRVLRPAGASSSRPPLSFACRLRGVDVFGVWVDEGRADLHWDAQVLRVTEFSASVGRDVRRGTVAGGLTLTEDELRARATLAVDPHVLLPGLRAFGFDQTRVFEWFSFPAVAPTCELTIERKWGAHAAVSVRGRLQATQFAYRGTAIGFGSLAGTYAWTPAAHTLDLNPVVLVVGGRNISGNLAVDLNAETVRLEALSLADVPALARIAGFREGSFLDAFAFGRDTRVYVKGRIGYRTFEVNDAEIAVESPSVCWGGITAEDCAFKVRLAGETNQVQDMRGRLAGGSFTATALFSPEAAGSDEVRYQVRGEILHADVNQVLGAWRPGTASRLDGRLYGNIDLAGRLGKGQGKTATGQGYVNIKRGTLYRVPLFGGFTEAMASAIPGVDFVTRQTDVRAPFEVQDGRIVSRDIQVEGDVLSLTGRGSATLDGGLDFTVQVRPLKDKTLVGTALRAVAYPISKLFEYRLQGTLSAPRWSSTTLSRLTGEGRP